MVSYGCLIPDLSDINTYSTFSRTVGPSSGLAPMANALCDTFGWTTVGIVFATESVNRQAAKATKHYMESKGKTVYYNIMPTSVSGDKVHEERLAKLKTVVRSMKNRVRIFLLFAYLYDFRNFLITAMDEGMLNGEYVYFGSDIGTILKFQYYDYRPDVDPFIYTGILIARYKNVYGPGYNQFTRNVINAFHEPQFHGLEHLPLNASNDMVMPHAGKSNWMTYNM